MFTIEELQQMVYFLNRCTLNGNESISHAKLLVKVQNMITQELAENK